MSAVGMTVDVNRETGRVIIDFDRTVDHLEFTPQQAGEFAKTIITRARMLVPKSSIIQLN